MDDWLHLYAFSKQYGKDKGQGQGKAKDKAKEAKTKRQRDKGKDEDRRQKTDSTFLGMLVGPQNRLLLDDFVF